jgi:hypothetical protein
LHRIEALAGQGRFVVTFERADRSEQTAVVQVTGDDVSAADASLPAGWTRGSEAFAALAEALRAVERACGMGPAGAALVDVDGGWDVMLGNVVLGSDDLPTCTAHGAMAATGEGRYECAECGARAAYAA